MLAGIVIALIFVYILGLIKMKFFPNERKTFNKYYDNTNAFRKTNKYDR